MSAFKITLFTAVALSLMSCSKEYVTLPLTVKIQVGEMPTRSKDPDEEVISDVNLFIFSEDGLLEDSYYMSWRELSKKSKMSMKVTLVRGVKSTIVCCANFGFKLGGITSLDGLDGYRYAMTYPDEYSKGMPMCGRVEKVWSTEDKEITVGLERLMAKISVRMDRTELDDGVKLAVKSVVIGNCPKSVTLKGPSAAVSDRDVFARGFIKSYSQADGLNKDVSAGLSEEVSVYMLENMQGDLLDDTVDDSGKILSGVKAKICSYIEIQAEYYSLEYHTKAGEALKYRFYLGESSGNFDIERNCHYHISVQPHGSGIDETSWRIDKTALEEE